LVIGAGGALHGLRIVCDVMRCAKNKVFIKALALARDAMRCAKNKVYLFNSS
jgi:hypothetical protein